MIALFFEVEPHPGHEQAYLDLAARLRPELERNGGVACLNRYRSLERPTRLLSHQYWHDRAHLDLWRNHSGHKAVQRAGRERHFADYRLRVGPVIAEQRPGGTAQRTADFDGAATGSRFIVSVEAKGRPVVLAGGESFESVYAPGEMVSLGSFVRVADGLAGLAAAAVRADAVVARLIAVERDYGPVHRAEAPPDLGP